jgi:hypothetical protein
MPGMFHCLAAFGDYTFAASNRGDLVIYNKTTECACYGQAPDKDYVDYVDMPGSSLETPDLEEDLAYQEVPVKRGRQSMMARFADDTSAPAVSVEEPKRSPMNFRDAGDMIRRATSEFKDEGNKRVSSVDVLQRARASRTAHTRKIDASFRKSVCAVRSNLELDILRRGTHAGPRRSLMPRMSAVVGDLQMRLEEQAMDTNAEEHEVEGIVADIDALRSEEAGAGFSMLSADLNSIRKAFDEIDEDKSGFLDHAEVRTFLSEKLGFGEDEIKRFIEATDRDESGTIEFEEFKNGFKLVQRLMCRKLMNYLVTRQPGTIHGDNFLVDHCFNCRVFVCDKVGIFQVEKTVNSEIVVGCAESVIIRDCRYCTIRVAAKRVTIRNCNNCKFFLFAEQRPVMQLCRRSQLADYNLWYPELDYHMQESGLARCWPLPASESVRMNKGLMPYDLDVKQGAATHGVRHVAVIESLAEWATVFPPMALGGAAHMPEHPKAPKLMKADLQKRQEAARRALDQAYLHGAYE